MEVEKYIEWAREQADSYSRTIQAIIAFDAAVRWDDSQNKYFDNSHFLPGRKFSRDKQDGYVSPDVALQLSSVYGIIGEVKLTASSERDFQKTNEQIQKYDADLIGWKTENKFINNHDISWLFSQLSG